MKKTISNIVKILTPDFTHKWLKGFYKYINNIFFKIKLHKVRRNHKRALEVVRQKNKVKVVFLLIHDSVWKYEGVYRLMEKDDRFDPIIAICPYTAYSKDIMIFEINKAFNSFLEKGYKVVKTLKKNGNWLDIKRELNPDLVCFTNPHELTLKQYLISNFLNTLTCYVPYGFKNSHLYEAHFNKKTQNFVWKFFLETEIHKKLSKKYSRNNSANTLVTGYPGMDMFIEKGFQPKDIWKIKEKPLKRIIWAPHHTIPGFGATLDYSTFFDYCNIMFEIADSYRDKVQFAFKPHPILRAKLSRDDVWGKEKTDNYYNKWANLDNSILCESDYFDLFLTSDGLIHDSSSFVIEYLYSGKPELFLIGDDSVKNNFNEVGNMALNVIYLANNKNGVLKFIDDVVINGKDFLKKEREVFFNDIIKPPNNNSASQNIFNYLVNEFFE
ncbi:MAG: CDP-glycerol glycerophosphotransferase family protein [Tenuifilaceae bacterium]|jgi:CDP-glycerol glycerophosphotransferase (TagB/SpsB family)|nr:CDP-glycerol glycerophosphotransferase family protein [Tenuifilaceae bacterium]